MIKGQFPGADPADDVTIDVLGKPREYKVAGGKHMFWYVSYNIGRSLYDKTNIALAYL